DICEVFGDEADVLVLGAPGQDLVADHQYPGGDDLAHDFNLPPASSELSRMPWRMPRQALEVTGFCRRFSHRSAVYSGTRKKCRTERPDPMHIVLARPLLPPRLVRRI